MQFLKQPLKRTLALSIMMLFATSAHSFPWEACARDKEEVCCEKYPPGPFAFSFPEDPGLACPIDLFVDVDLLVMQAKEDGLEYAISDRSATLGQFPVTGSVQSFSRDFRDWGWNLGCRVGVGIHVSKDLWTLSAMWTFLNISDSTTANVDPSQTLIPLWAGPTTTITTDQARAVWKTNFNTLDVMLGKPYKLSRCFVVHPEFGLRAAWIDQDYQAHYTGRITSSNNYWGLGLRAAMQSTFVLGSGWGIFGKTAGSILFSHFDVDQDYPNTAHGYNLHNEFYTSSPNWELAAGISWGFKFNRGKEYFGLKLAYEFQQWFDQNRMRRFFGTVAAGTIPNDTVSKGDLTLNGLSLRATFEF